MILRPLHEGDLEACRVIDCQVSDHPWSLSIFQRGLQNSHWARVGVDDTDGLVAFCICLLVADELSVLNIAVRPDWQRRGVARRLLSEALTAGRAGGAEQAFLEVRQSNVAAQALYGEMEFHVVGVRENYYPARNTSRSAAPGREHALIMARTLL